jgi:hypothetical protein
MTEKIKEARPMAKRLSKKELQAVLDATIRRRSAWELNDQESGVLGTNYDDEMVTKAAKRVYDDIVSDFTHNDNLVNATRSVKNFGHAYVRKVMADSMESAEFKAILAAAKAVKEYKAEK